MLVESHRYPHAPLEKDGFARQKVVFVLSDINAAYLQELETREIFTFKPTNKVTIDGAQMKDLKVNLDGRGYLIELWKEEWLDEGWIRPRHIYESGTDEGVVKSWHLHGEHTDQFAITKNKVQVVLVDLRAESPTFGHVNSLVVGRQKPAAILIPPGVMHGWKAIVGEISVNNHQTHPYDSKDEGKIPWDCVLTGVWEPKNG